MEQDNLNPENNQDNSNPENNADNNAVNTATLTKDWRSGIDETLRAHPSMQNFTGVNDLAKGYIEAQKLVGKEKIPVPTKPITEAPQEYEVVFNRLGRPSDPKDYKMPEVEIPEGAEALKPSPEELDNFKLLAHKIGLLPHQVEALYRFNHERNLSVFNSMNEAATTSRQEAEATLRKEYGKAYDANLALANQVIAKFGDESTRALIEEGVGNDPRFIKFMVKVAKQFGEDGSTLGEARTAILTPEEAKAEIAAIQADKEGPYKNKNHPEHLAMVDKVRRLYQMAYPK